MPKQEPFAIRQYGGFRVICCLEADADVFDISSEWLSFAEECERQPFRCMIAIVLLTDQVSGVPAVRV